MPLTPAEKQQAYRERQIERELHDAAFRRYLEDAEAGARWVSAERGEDETRAEERVQRALNYAHRRWDGFLLGEVASL